MGQEEDVEPLTRELGAIGFGFHVQGVSLVASAIETQYVPWKWPIRAWLVLLTRMAAFVPLRVGNAATMGSGWINKCTIGGWIGDDRVQSMR